jgi:hypothetical protein
MAFELAPLTVKHPETEKKSGTRKARTGTIVRC